MFGTNSIVGQKYFADAPENTLMVTSKFFTIQGEGPYMGQPAYFFRLSKCNLNCSFCDAFFDKGEYYTYEQLVSVMETEVPSYFLNSGLIVLTGGEPYLQKIGPFIEFLQDRGYTIQIETNGILANSHYISPTKLAPVYPDMVVCSPKCSEKTGKYLSMAESTVSVIDCLKFVVSADPSSPYHKIPDWALAIQRDLGKPIFISPMNMYERLPLKARGDGDINDRSTKDEIISFWEPGLLNQEQNQANHEYAARYALEINAILNLQMHLYASLA